MALRMIEMVIPQGRLYQVDEVLEEHHVGERWDDHLVDEVVRVKLLVQAEETEPLLDELAKKFAVIPDFRMVLIPVEATVPRIEEPVQEDEAVEEPPRVRVGRVSREELYGATSETARSSRVFIAMVVLSSVVASIGILRDNVAIIIGAMVIAPLLGPNVALSLATILGDAALARKALQATATGALIAFGIAVGLGAVLTVDPTLGEISSRTDVGLGDIVLALASGSAAVLAFTSGLSAALIGVMVAVALLPPLITFGILLGSGHYELALGALLLVAANVISVNLAGVVTFAAQGVRPLTWWEEKRARTATRNAIIVWLVLLAGLAAVIVLARAG